jgi:hypothetical protein
MRRPYPYLVYQTAVRPWGGNDLSHVVLLLHLRFRFFHLIRGGGVVFQ